MSEKNTIQFMVRVKLPNSASFHCSPSGDTEYEQAFRDAIFAAKPDGFEVKWPRPGQQWPVDSEGYTFVPLFLNSKDPEDGRLLFLNETMELKKELASIKKSLRRILGLET